MTDEEARERARQRLANRKAQESVRSGSIDSSRASVGRSSDYFSQSRNTVSSRHSASESSTFRAPISGTDQSRVSRRKPTFATAPLPIRVLRYFGNALMLLLRVVLGLLVRLIQGVHSRFGARGIVVLVVAVVLVVLAACSLQTCTNASADTALENDTTSQPEPLPKETIDTQKLRGILGADLAKQMIDAAETNADVAWIAAHPDEYAGSGEGYQQKILKLATVEPEAVPFVRAYPDEFPKASAQPSQEVSKGEIPRLYQWDLRWGTTEYSSEAFGLTGCCPTALAMVYQGLTGKNDKSPYDMAQLARADGYETEFNGTIGDFLLYDANKIGLSCLPTQVNKDSLRWVLENGYVVICNVGPGDFTDDGHFIVICGINNNGTLQVNDPYSAQRSNQEWSIDDIIRQTRSLWAYKLAE